MALVSPGGDVRLEHASRDLLEVPAAREDITGEALAAILELLACPPLCCNLEHPSRRLERAARVQRQAPYHRPARAPRVDADASALPPWRFPPFPLSLDPCTYRPPPLSAVLDNTPRTERRLLLAADCRPLVQSTLFPPRH